jgi:2-keto-4-pentenoate hydratase
MSNHDLMNTDRIAEATSLLAVARRYGARLPELPESCRPQSIEEAYAIQDEVAKSLGEAIGGWKVGALSYQHPSTVAPIFASTILPSPAVLDANTMALFGVEAEIAFLFDAGLQPRTEAYGREEVLNAVTSVHPVIEILESRYRDILGVDRRSAVADNISNGYLIVGPSIERWRDRDLERPFVKMTANDRLLALCIGNNGGDPIRLLVEGVNHVASKRGGLKPGAIITTGTLTGIVFSEPGKTVVADYRRLGRVQVEFAV